LKKICITGTKGKTTVSAVLAQVLAVLEPEVLKVDTAGVYLNGELKLSKSDSQRIWDVVPTVAPGRFLYLMNDGKDLDGKHHGEIPGVAVLEASLGCGTLSGLGYYGHDIGIFTNVFEDHLGSRADLQTRADIGQSKRFVFSRINQNGTAVFNADDDIVTSLLHECKDTVNLLPFGLNFQHFDLEKHLAAGGNALTLDDQQNVVLHKGKETQVLFDAKDVNWTFQAAYEPSLYNLLAITAALLAYCEMSLPEKVKKALLESKLDPSGGRLVLMKNTAGVTVLGDYAHEKQSLKTIAQLAHELTASPDNQVIGVLRLTWDRTESLIRETAHFIADDYDQFVIYDKIDGHWRQPSSRFRTGQREFTQEVGKISKLFSDALIEKRGEEVVTRILREDEAIAEAAKLAKPGDVVVHIVNDDIQRSLDFLTKSFQAELV